MEFYEKNNLSLFLGKTHKVVYDLSAHNLEEWAKLLIRIPRAGNSRPLDLKGRRPFVDIFNSKSNRKLLMGGRQIGKSVYLATESLILSALIPYLRSLIVLPRESQAKIISKDKLSLFADSSPALNKIKGGTGKDSVFIKEFKNSSLISLKGAFRSADRIRSMYADVLYMDEMQDLLPEIIPVVEEVLSSAYIEDTDIKRTFDPLIRYGGTVKTGRDPLSFYYDRYSTKYEWAIPCDHHTPRHWVTISEKNIGKGGLICERCGNTIYPDHEDAHWVALADNPKEKTILGWRLPQVIFPLSDWSIITDKRDKYADKFWTEVLALPRDTSVHPITEKLFTSLCDNSSPNTAVKYKDWERYSRSYPTFAGIDWGPGAKSYTVLTIGGYFNTTKFRFFYMRKYESGESDPEFLLNDLVKQINRFHVQLVGVDYGFGFGMNDPLARRLSIPVYQFQHSSSSILGKWSNTARRFILDRTGVLDKYFAAIKRHEFIFPAYKSIEELAQNFYAVDAVYNEQTGKMLYTHHPDDPDDAVHSSLYSFLVSTLKIPRREFFIAMPDNNNN